MNHGRDADYYQHRIKGVPFPEDAGGEPCGCRAAHTAAEKRRAKNRPQRPRARVWTRERRPCPECGHPMVTSCSSCAQRRVMAERAAAEFAPVQWVRVGLIWRAAA